MTDAEDTVPDEIAIEEEPTLTWEPGADAAPSDKGTARLEGAFAWALIIEGGPQTGLTYVLGVGDSFAGRGASSNIYLPDVTVSRDHARFNVSLNGLTVTDLASTNGTYVNGVRRATGALEVDDLLMIGKFHLRVSKGNG
jgi:hypothetical protein